MRGASRASSATADLLVWKVMYIMVNQQVFNLPGS